MDTRMRSVGCESQLSSLLVAWLCSLMSLYISLLICKRLHFMCLHPMLANTEKALSPNPLQAFKEVSYYYILYNNKFCIPWPSELEQKHGVSLDFDSVTY